MSFHEPLLWKGKISVEQKNSVSIYCRAFLASGLSVRQIFWQDFRIAHDYDIQSHMKLWPAKLLMRIQFLSSFASQRPGDLYSAIDHSNRSSLHLNKGGTSVLAQNFINYLRVDFS